MSVLWLPGPVAPEETPWPTLGPQVIYFMEEQLVHGPGDLLGQPYRLTDEWKALICHMYEVYPDDHELAGRRRFKRAVISLAKGLAKTEVAAAIGIAEASPSAPVRTMIESDRAVFDGQGNPIGGPVRSPFVPMVAYTEEQTEELAYGAARAILERCGLGDEFDIGLDRIVRRSDGGEIRALASSPSARDGARTTFQHFDETHRFNRAVLRAAHQTMLNNIPKRYIADPWTLETTTAFGPGEDSVAEVAHEWAKAVEAGKKAIDPTVFYFHRQASDRHDITTKEGREAAVREASGPSGLFRDLAAVVNLYDSPGTDKAFWERVWGNRPVQQERKAFDLDRWRALSRTGVDIPEGAKVVIGFDGSQFDDATSLTVRDIATGHSRSLGLWERPDGPAGEDWQVPTEEVTAMVTWAFDYYDVWRLYADPAHWQDTIATWAGRYGSERIIEWWTNRTKPMAYAVKAFIEALRTGAITNDGDPDVTRHIGNACKVPTRHRDEDDQPLFYISKERPMSPNKMDAAMTEVLSNEARNDAIAAGVLEETDEGPAFPVFFGAEAGR